MKRMFLVVALLAAFAAATVGMAIAGGGTTYCDSYGIPGVGLFVLPACSSDGAGQVIDTVGGQTLAETEFNEAISSVYVAEGWSVLVYEHPDGTGLSQCLSESKWDLTGDPWEDDNTRMMGDSISYVTVFDNDGCRVEAPPPPTTYCDAHASFEGVRLFSMPGCETPAGIEHSLPFPLEYSLEGAEIDNATSAVYVSEGWSVLVAENPDGTGLSQCIRETKWNLDGDTWEGSSKLMGDSISWAQVFVNAECVDDGIIGPPPNMPFQIFLPAIRG